MTDKNLIPADQESSTEAVPVSSMEELLEHIKTVTGPCQLKFQLNFVPNMLQLGFLPTRAVYDLRIGLRVGGYYPENGFVTYFITNLEGVPETSRLYGNKPQVVEQMAGMGLAKYIKGMTPEQLTAGLIVRGEVNEQMILLINVVLRAEGISITGAVANEVGTKLSFTYNGKTDNQET